MSKITRSKRNTPFVLINKESLQDKSISWQAKGLLAYLLSLPDNWQILVSDLSNRSKNGRDSTAAILNELIEAGYIERVRCKNEKNQFDGYSYTVFDSPQTEKPNTEKPFTGNPFTGFPNTGKPTLINNNSNKETLNKNRESTPAQNFEVPPHKTDETQKNWNTKTDEAWKVEIKGAPVFQNLSEENQQSVLAFCNYRQECLNIDPEAKPKQLPTSTAKQILKTFILFQKDYKDELIRDCIDHAIKSSHSTFNPIYLLNATKDKRESTSPKIKADYTPPYKIPEFENENQRFMFFFARFEKYRPHHPDRSFANTKLKDRALMKKEAEQVCYELEQQYPELLKYAQ